MSKPVQYSDIMLLKRLETVLGDVLTLYVSNKSCIFSYNYFDLDHVIAPKKHRCRLSEFTK